MLFEAFLGQGYKSCLFCTSAGETKRKEGGGCKLFFPLPAWQSNTDISTEACVSQQLLPDAVIEPPMSNRERKKCFIELELSLVIVSGRSGRSGRGQRAGVPSVVVDSAEISP